MKPVTITIEVKMDNLGKRVPGMRTITRAVLDHMASFEVRGRTYHLGVQSIGLCVFIPIAAEDSDDD